ncbi:hypothetical protein GQ607_010062 [Colletotrichum asianum]|uniref:Uncharacterized protein n=1 Tax=Colletotrichum asianum TaxID=702518 RepID=A0A8H3WBS3_9PEZI|nr:hypothetical protein GQ607_010062 [Colletotrichum asianum]
MRLWGWEVKQANLLQIANWQMNFGIGRNENLHLTD